MRTKTVTIEGQDFTIAPLNIEQVEDLLDTDTSTVKAAREAGLKTICAGLNNAGVTSEPATPENMRKTLDLPTYSQLHSAVLEFSGLKVVKQGEAQPSPGAAQTSGTSAGA